MRAGHVASIFVQIPRNFAGKSVRAALGFELADIAIHFAGAIEFVPSAVTPLHRFWEWRMCVGIEQALCPRGGGVKVTEARRHAA